MNSRQSLEVRPAGLDGVLEVLPARFGDSRGFFSEVYNKQRFCEAGVDLEFVQDNHSLSREAGVLRGLHYQLPDRAQDKLVRVLRGRIFDVAVDIRRGSSTFARWVARELSADRWNQLLVPKGFAHGFLTMEPNTEVAYKVSDYYSPAHDRSILYCDPDIGIEWPIAAGSVVLSDKDRAAPLLKDAEIFE